MHTASLERATGQPVVAVEDGVKHQAKDDCQNVLRRSRELLEEAYFASSSHGDYSYATPRQEETEAVLCRRSVEGLIQDLSSG